MALTRANASYQSAVQSDKAVPLQELRGALDSCFDLLREHVQTLTDGAIRKVVEKLDSDEPLSRVEVAQARLWMVGDADAYLQVEDRFELWMRELEHTMEALNEGLMDPPDLGAAVRLQALIKRCLNTLPAILTYQAQRERVAHFETMMQKLEGGTRKMMKLLLEEKIRSAQA